MEAGAQWIHGIKGSVAYKIASDMDLLDDPESGWLEEIGEEFYYDNGEAVDEDTTGRSISWRTGFSSVNLDFGCSTILPNHTASSANFPSSNAEPGRRWNCQNQSPPNPSQRRDGPPCTEKFWHYYEQLEELQEDYDTKKSETVGAFFDKAVRQVAGESRTAEMFKDYMHRELMVSKEGNVLVWLRVARWHPRDNNPSCLTRILPDFRRL